MYQYAADELRTDALTRRILDVGCSFGYGSHLMSEMIQGADVIGIDLEQEKIEESQRCFGGPRVEFIRADATVPAEVDLLAEGGHFDAIVCFEVLEHIPRDKTKALLENLRRVLRSGGWLFLSTPNREIYDIDAYTEGHINELTYDGFIEALKEVGFHPTEVLGIELKSTSSSALLRELRLVKRDGDKRVVLTKAQRLMRKAIASLLDCRALMSYLLSHMSKRRYYEWKYKTAINRRPEQSHIVLAKVSCSKEVG